MTTRSDVILELVISNSQYYCLSSQAIQSVSSISVCPTPSNNYISFIWLLVFGVLNVNVDACDCTPWNSVRESALTVNSVRKITCHSGLKPVSILHLAFWFVALPSEQHLPPFTHCLCQNLAHDTEMHH